MAAFYTHNWRRSMQAPNSYSLMPYLSGLKQVEDGACVPGLTIRPFASTADVEALMCSASATQHAASSHLVLSVYAACKDHTTGANLMHSKHSVAMTVPCMSPCRAPQVRTVSSVHESVSCGFTGKQRACAATACMPLAACCLLCVQWYEAHYCAGAAALGKLHLASLAAPEEADRAGDHSLTALSTCLQARSCLSCAMPQGWRDCNNT